MAENEIVKKEDNKIQTVSVDASSYSSFLDTAKFNQIWRAANMFAGSMTVPKHYQGKPNDCFIAFVIAERLRQDPFMFMQKTYIVSGKLGYEAQEIIALANSRGVFAGPINWKFSGEGKNRSCTAFATVKADGKVRESTLTWETVEKEGWAKNPKWHTMTDHMFKYRSASFLISEVCPEVKMGMYTKEELEDIEGQPEKTDHRLPESSLNERLSKKVDNTAVEPEPETSNPVDETSTEEQGGDIQEPDTAPADEPEQPASEIGPEERFYCRDCEAVFPNPTGKSKNKCPKCFSLEVVDRKMAK